jgi:hypothetical protein
MRFDRGAVAVLALLASLVAAGCTRTVLEDSAIDRFAGPESELDFWDDVSTRSVVTNHDAIHGLLLVAGETPLVDYEARLAEARRRGWVDGTRRPDENESATVGMIAVAVCDLMGTEGGLTMRVFGPSPRACTREIVFLELIPPRTDNQSLSGLEFIDLVSRVERSVEEGDAS